MIISLNLLRFEQLEAGYGRTEKSLVFLSKLFRETDILSIFVPLGLAQ